MTEFEFRAVRRDGAEVRGREHAESEGLLVDALRRRQLALLDARPLKPRAVGFGLTLALVSELSPLLGSGIPLEQCLKIIAEDTGDPRLAGLAEQLREVIKRNDPAPGNGEIAEREQDARAQRQGHFRAFGKDVL